MFCKSPSLKPRSCHLFRSKRARHVPLLSRPRPYHFLFTGSPKSRCFATNKRPAEDVYFPVKQKESVPPHSGWLTFWGALDAGAWLGALGSAAAFLITQEALLAAAPVVLPLFALYASKQRERLATEASQAELAQRSQQLLQSMSQLARGAAGEAAATEMARAVELQQRAKENSEKTLKSLEAKLAAVEGSVLSTGGVTREALREAATSQGRTAQELFVRLEALGAAVRRDVASEVRQSGVEEMALLSRLEGRLQSLEGAIQSLEESQLQSQRQLPRVLASALEETGANLEEAVRWEAQRSLEPLRRLPQLLAQAMPITPEVLPPDRQQVSEEGLRDMISQQLALATRAILEQQASLLQEIRDQPQLVAPAQWNQLGSRLVSLQGEVKQLLAAQEAAAEAAQQAAQQAGQLSQPPALQAELSAQLEALRADVAALSASVAELTHRSLGASPEGAAAEGHEDAGSSTLQQAQQAQQLGEMVLLLQGLSGRLDEVGSQVADAMAQQGQHATLNEALQQGPGLAGEGVSPGGAQAAEEGAEVAQIPPPGLQAQEQGMEGGTSREAAYRRMQALLASKEGTGSSSLAASSGDGDEDVGGGVEVGSETFAGSGVEGVDQGAVPISQWLSGAVQSSPTASSSAAPAAADGSGGLLSNGGGVWSKGVGYGGAQSAAAGLGPPPSEALVGDGRWGGDAGGGGSSSGSDAQALMGGGGSGEGEGEASSGQELVGGEDLAAGSSRDPGGWAPPFIRGQIQYGVALGVDPAGVGGGGMEQGISGEGEGLGTEGGGVRSEPSPGVAAGTVADWYQGQAEGGPGAPPAAQGAALQAGRQLGEAAFPQGQPEQAQRTAGPAQPSWQRPDLPPAAGPWNATDAQLVAAEDLMEPGDLPGDPADSTVDLMSTPQAPSWDAAESAVPGAPSAEPAMQAGRGYSSEPLSLDGLSFEELCERGRQRLKEGRAMAAEPGVDLGLVDSVFWEAEDCLEAALKLQPDDLKALGNLGNSLMAHGRLRLQMLRLLPPEAYAEPAEVPTAELAAGTRLEEEALSLLLLAGRKYKRVLELDDSQERAMVNWGRCVCLRAEVAKGRGLMQEAADLFSLAADKFDAALDLNPQNSQALRLGGMALLDMALCLMSSDRKQAKQLLKDAEGYLTSAVGVNPQDQLSQQKVGECKEWLEYLKGAR